MTTETELGKPFLGVGKIHARAFGTTGKWRFVGNASAFVPSHKLDVQKQADYTRTGGGTAYRLARIASVDLAMTWLSFSAANMELAVAGDSAIVVGAPIADEVVKGYKDAMVPLLHPPMSITTVKNSAGSTTYDPIDEDTGIGDYRKTPAGLFIPSTSTVVDAADLKVTYVHDDYVNIEAATNNNRQVELLLEGQNEADGGNAVIGHYWRVSIPAADKLEMLGGKLGELAFQAECLNDPSKGLGVSAFYRLRQVTPA